MIKITSDKVTDIFAADVAPAATCFSGETVTFETRDCYDDMLIDEANPLGGDPEALENPATGPLFVRGAKKGDILRVDIIDIALRSWGAMRCSYTDGAFKDRFFERRARIFNIDGRTVRFDDKLTLELEPMLGVIGTAPCGEGVPAITPGAHGGNMDCKLIGVGTTLYLPVNVDGALLCIGDVHALMGDGEVFICGLETAAEVTVRVTVIKGEWLPTPFLAAGQSVMTIQSAQTLDEAAHLAANLMLDFVKRATGYDDFEAGMLMSLVSDTRICQIVDPLKTVRTEFPLAPLAAHGWKLP